MSTCMPTRLRAATDPHPAPATRASNRLRITLRFIAAVPRTPPAHRRTSLLWSPSSSFVPIQPHQLPANSIQSPYIHRANGLLQIAVSTPLRIHSIGAREVLAAEHCRYGTRDLASIYEPWCRSYRERRFSSTRDCSLLAQTTWSSRCSGFLRGRALRVRYWIWRRVGQAG
jgi:hypothetical protein